jgi:hypothetical protein
MSGLGVQQVQRVYLSSRAHDQSGCCSDLANSEIKPEGELNEKVAIVWMTVYYENGLLIN